MTYAAVTKELGTDVDDADLFDRAMSSYGGRLQRNWPHGSPPEKAYRQLATLAESLISSAREAVPGLPHIHFDFVLNGQPNAWAFKSQGTYFIGITTGIRYLLELVFCRILSDSRLLTIIGDPSGERNDLPLITGYVPDAQEMYQAGAVPSRPRTDARWSYMTRLLSHAIQFLVGHEIAHISLGHVDYLESRAQNPFIAELGWVSVDQNDLVERQTLEWHADQRSVFSGVDSIRLIHTTPDLPIPPWRNVRDTPQSSMFNWAFAMNSLFRLMGDGRFNQSTITELNYPPLALRRAMATVGAYAYVMKLWDRALKDVTIVALRLALHQTEAAFATILGENEPVGGLSDAFAPLGQEHHNRLIDCWTCGLSDRVAQYAYELEPNQRLTGGLEFPN